MAKRTEVVTFPMPQNVHIAELAVGTFARRYDNAFPIQVFIRGSVFHFNGIRGYLSDWHQVMKLRGDEEYCFGLDNPLGEVIWVKPRWGVSPYDDAMCEMKLECVLWE